MTPLHKIILGDNQFFGINHMSEAKAQEQSERFRDDSSIIEAIDYAYQCGVRALMMTTHERAAGICGYLRENARRYPDLALYPALPYAHKYANAVNEKGLVAALTDFLVAGRSAWGIADTLLRGGRGVLTQDTMALMKVLVDNELRPFAGLNVPVVFLQNIVADLLLGCRVKAAFIEFSRHIRTKYNAEAGFITMNLPRMVDYLLDCGLENPIVCGSVNKIGYLMNPDIASYEETIRTKPFRPLAMSVLASGAVPSAEAVQYVAGLGRIEGIVFGASSRSNIAVTAKLITDAFSREPVCEPGSRRTRETITDDAMNYVQAAAETGSL